MNASGSDSALKRAYIRKSDVHEHKRHASYSERDDMRMDRADAEAAKQQSGREIHILSREKCRKKRTKKRTAHTYASV